MAYTYSEEAPYDQHGDNVYDMDDDQEQYHGDQHWNGEDNHFDPEWNDHGDDPTTLDNTHYPEGDGYTQDPANGDEVGNEQDWLDPGEYDYHDPEDDQQGPDDQHEADDGHEPDGQYEADDQHEPDDEEQSDEQHQHDGQQPSDDQHSMDSQQQPAAKEPSADPQSYTVAEQPGHPASTNPSPQENGHVPQPDSAPQAPGSNLFNIALLNDSQEQTIYCYVTGQNIDNGNKSYILQSDGHTTWDAPDQATDVPHDCVITMSHLGSTTDIWIPHTAGGRIWFSYGQPLTFKTGSNGALVEPSVSAAGEANIDTEWGFAEFTWNTTQLYANISYVDFVGLPIALELEVDKSKGEQDPAPVRGITPESIAQIAQGLHEQNDKDHAGWDQLIVPRKDEPSKPLRILSPNQATVMHPDIPLSKYFDDYIKQVWQKWTAGINVDTQSQGVVPGKVDSDHFTAKSANIATPSTHDIWTCCTGAFQTVSDTLTMALIPRLGAAINRGSALKDGNAQNLPEPQDEYYKGQYANHYARLVHAANPDGKGYAFPYDDVQPTGGVDQSGEVHSGAPQRLIVTVGGMSAGNEGQGQEGEQDQS